MLPLFASPLAGTVEVGERTEVRARDSGAGVQTDAEAAFRFRLGLRGRRFELSLGATPRIAAYSWADSQRAILASAPGQLALGYREKRFGVFLSQDGSYGLENYATLRYPSATPLPGAPPDSPSSPTPLPTLPPASTITYVASRSALSAYQVPTSRWTITEAAAFEVNGGATSTAQNFVPLQYGPRLALGLDHRVTRRDHLGATADAQFSHFSNDADAGIAGVLLRYGRDLARGTTLGFGAGPSGAAFRVRPESYHLRLYPTAEITLAHHRGFYGNKLDVDAAIRLGPVVDRIAGTVDPRVSVALAGVYTTRSYALRLGASFVQSVLPDSPANVTALGVEAILRLPLTRTIAFEGGSRLAIQSFQGGAFATYAFFLALDLHPDVLHFRTP